MKLRKIATLFLLSITVMFFAACATKALDTAQLPTPAIAESGIEYPVDYRSTFSNYLSLDRIQNPDQIIRLYANDAAMEGPNEEGKLPFGSVLVGEVYKAQLDDSGEVKVSSIGRRLRGDLALIAVMERRQGFGEDLPDNLKNEHWDFAAFKPDGSVAEKKELNSCRECHAPLKSTHHLFSYEHLNLKELEKGA